MPVRINFMDGTSVVIDAALDEIEAAYRKALANGGPLRINTDAGSVVMNPQQIIYFETPGVRPVKTRERYFDSFDYDAENDVLYLSIGKPRAGYGEETPEGHIARFDETGEFCGVTLIGVRQKLDKGDWR